MHEVILVVDNKMWVLQELDLVKFYSDMPDLQIILILLGHVQLTLELYPIKTILYHSFH